MTQYTNAGFCEPALLASPGQQGKDSASRGIRFPVPARRTEHVSFSQDASKNVQFNYDCDGDEAGNELRELMTGPKLLKDFSFSRPTSAASTTATPGPDDRLSPFQSRGSWDFGSPSGASDGFAADFGGISGVTTKETATRNSGQARKAFVGGVPQEMTLDQLRTLMVQYGDVKRLWLQKDKYQRSDAPLTKHRGFAFVVFQNESSLDRLLAGKANRFIDIPGGRRLEVKRALTMAAVSKEQTTAAPGEVLRSSPTTAASRAASKPMAPTGAALPAVPPMPIPAVPPMPTVANTNGAPRRPGQPSAGAGEMVAEAPGSKTAAKQTSQQQMMFVAPMIYMPCGGAATQQAPAVAAAAPAPTPAAAVLPKAPADPPRSQGEAWLATLEHALAGMPTDGRRKLEKMLLEAQPDHYDD